MSKVTLCMIVKNEEKYLRECLESVKDAADEIVIVDTGSTDKTLEIAKEFGAKIFHFKWINDFSAARNYALSKSTGDWILYLDADERLNGKSKTELKKVINSNETLGIKCTVKSFDENGKVSQSMKYPRLFKNIPSIKFTGKVHEQIETSLITNNYKIVNSDIEIVHIGYGVNRDGLEKKAERNLSLLLEEYKNNKSSIVSYQLANSYSILNQNNVAAKYYKLALSSNGLKKEFKSVCYSRLADFEMRNNNLKSALNYIESGLKLDKNNVFLNIVSSQIFARENKADKALKYCKKALRQSIVSSRSSNYSYAQDVFIDQKKIIYEGILYSIQFNNKDYLEYFLRDFEILDNDERNLLNKLLLFNEFRKENVEYLDDIITKNNLDFYLKVIDKISNIEFKLDIYSKIFNKFPTDSKYLNSFGAFLISINQLEEAKIILESAINNNSYEDSTIFYLSSIYIKTNELEKLKVLILTAEENLKDNPPLANKLKLLKEKISSILSI